MDDGILVKNIDKQAFFYDVVDMMQHFFFAGIVYLRNFAGDKNTDYQILIAQIEKTLNIILFTVRKR